MDGCKLIIEYEVDCTFEFQDEDNDKSVIAVIDKEIETSKGKIRHTSPDIYMNTQPIRICYHFDNIKYRKKFSGSGKVATSPSGPHVFKTVISQIFNHRIRIY